VKYLLIGIWHGERPEVQSHKTDRREDAEHSAYAVTRHADREDVPDQILMIEEVRGGPALAFSWESCRDYSQKDYDQRRSGIPVDDAPLCPRPGHEPTRMVYADGKAPYHDLKHPHWRCELWVGSGVCGATRPYSASPRSGRGEGAK
jgi:hypothetical protein